MSWCACVCVYVYILLNIADAIIAAAAAAAALWLIDMAECHVGLYMHIRQPHI